MLHFGHLVHNPSGISRFLGLLASLGFFANVALFAGGGVTAGSGVSRPSSFFVKLVAMCVDNIQVPRATVQTQTAPAPAARSTCAQALVVAPVVSTSSTNTIRSPLSFSLDRQAKA